MSSLAPTAWREEFHAAVALQRVSAARERTFRWVIALMCAIIFEGAFRKWLLPPSLAPVAYVSKDVIGLAFVLTHPIPPQFRAVCRTRLLFGVLGVVLVYPLLHGLSGSAAPAILRYKNAVLWPLIALHLAANIDSKTLDRITRLLAPVTVGIAALGVVQFGSSPGAFINKYAWSSLEAETAITFGGATGVRATGTFSFMSGMTTYAVLVFSFLLWRLLVMKDARERKFILAGMISAVVCGLTSGARYIVVGMGLPALLTLLASRNFKALLRLSLAGSLLGVVLWMGSGSGVLGAFIDRLQGSGDSLTDRVTGAGFRADYGEFLGERPFGAGLGQSSVLARQAGIENAMFDHPVSNLVVESGFLGLIGLALTALASVSLIREGLSSSGVFYLGTFAIALLGLYGLVNDAWANHVTTALNWSVIGFWFSTHPTFAAAEAEAAVVEDAMTESAGGES